MIAEQYNKRENFINSLIRHEKRLGGISKLMISYGFIN